jgi:hypothetical protein
MKKRAFYFLAIATAVLAGAATVDKCSANTVFGNAFKGSKLTNPAVIRIEYDCTWDYCPPRPRPPRRSPARQGNMYIGNNYGTVNVYEGRFSAPGKPLAVPPVGPGEANFDADPPCDGGSPCETHCDTACWLRRYKEGYCGHGCGFYRRKVYFERGWRLVPYPRAVTTYSRPDYAYTEPTSLCKPGEICSEPPPFTQYGPGYERQAPRYYDEPPAGALEPRRRFEGPKYPAD